MAEVTFNGNVVHVAGHFPLLGETVKSFMLVDQALNDVSLSQFTGKRKLLSIVPSLDTPVCALSTKKFDEAAERLPNTVVLVISADLPFAQQRVYETNQLKRVVMLSALRGRDFHKDYGVLITSHPLAGLMARAVIVLDEEDHVLYSELVDEITHEPNYLKAIAALQDNEDDSVLPTP